MKNNKLYFSLFFALKLTLVFLTITNHIGYLLFIFIVNPFSTVCYYFLTKSKIQLKKRYLIPACTIDIFIPFFGPFIILSTLLVYSLLKLFGKKNSFSRDYEELNHVTPPHRSTPENINISLTKINAMPYFDIIDSGSFKEKLMAIDKASRLRGTASIQILKKALNSNEYEIKYLAKNSIEKIEANLVSEIEMATEAIKHNPRSYKTYNFRANLYLSIDYIKIYEKEISDYFIKKGIQDLNSSLQLWPDQPDIYIKLVAALIKINDFDKALNFIQLCLTKDISEVKKIKLQFYEAECYFKRRDFAKVKEIISHMNKNRVSFDILKSSFETWSASTHD